MDSAAVGALEQGPLRYNEIRRVADGISQRMLTLTPKWLERDGLVNRTMYPTIPPRVAYKPTGLGRLMVPLRSLYDWALKHRATVLVRSSWHVVLSPACALSSD